MAVNRPGLLGQDTSLGGRTRGAFGGFEEVNLMSFTVGTPYWHQPWFYAIQIVILGIIILITSRLNEKNPRNLKTEMG